MMDHSRRTLLITGSILGTLILGSLLPAYCTAPQMKGKSILSAHTAPKRPKGQPKPLLEEDIGPILKRLDVWYAANLPEDQFVFNRPASDEDIDAIERLFGLKLPNAYRQLYKWHDGDRNDLFSGHIYGTALISLRDAGLQWKAWNDVLADFGGNRYEIPGGAWPEAAVDPSYINPRWIPLTNSDGNHIGLDFDPWPGGRIGQVILYGRDEDVKVVLAESLGNFLEWITDLLDQGNFRIESANEGPPMRFGLKNPPTDYFLDGVRTLLGAPGPFL
jgi:cell wall assembly regulator SMI1